MWSEDLVRSKVGGQLSVTQHEVMTCCVIMHSMLVENERTDGRNEHQ
jgi:hypothetical protein